MHDVGGNDTYFLQRQLKMESLRQQFARATNASVNRRGSLRWNEFSRINVQVPTPQEQRTIAQVLRDVDAEIECLERRLTSTRLIKQGMMQELLTGRTRLPVEEVAS
jgi:type I restriction enzyme S subunit